MHTYTVTHPDEAVNDTLNKVSEAAKDGVKRFPDKSYEEGVREAIEWLIGFTDDNPYPEAEEDGS
jgi:hypothetical protein